MNNYLEQDREAEIKKSIREEYIKGLINYKYLSDRIRKLLLSEPSDQLNKQIKEIDKERHEQHLRLMEMGHGLDKSESSVLADIIRKDNTLEEYGLPEFSILTDEDVLESDDWHDPYMFNIDGKERMPSSEDIPAHMVEMYKSAIGKNNVMIVYSISTVGEYDIVYEQDFDVRKRRAELLAKEVNGELFNKSNSGFHTAVAEILGVVIPSNQLEKVCSIIANDPEKFRVGEEFYSSEELTEIANNPKPDYGDDSEDRRW